MSIIIPLYSSHLFPNGIYIDYWMITENHLFYTNIRSTRSKIFGKVLINIYIKIIIIKI